MGRKLSQAIGEDVGQCGQPREAKPIRGTAAVLGRRALCSSLLVGNPGTAKQLKPHFQNDFDPGIISLDLMHQGLDKEPRYRGAFSGGLGPKVLRSWGKGRRGFGSYISLSPLKTFPFA